MKFANFSTCYLFYGKSTLSRTAPKTSVAPSNTIRSQNPVILLRFPSSFEGKDDFTLLSLSLTSGKEDSVHMFHPS